jgi:hypothetical protein
MVMIRTEERDESMIEVHYRLGEREGVGVERRQKNRQIFGRAFALQSCYS